MKYLSQALVLLFFSFLCTHQEDTRHHNTYNEGFYTKSKHRSSSNDFVITASVNDLHMASTQLSGYIKVNECSKYRIGSKGNFIHHRYDPDTEQSVVSEFNFIDAHALGYIPLVTEPMDLVSGDSIHVDFFMQNDWRPLDYCLYDDEIDSETFYRPDKTP